MGKIKSAVSIVAQALERLKEGKMRLDSAWLFVKHATMAQKVYKKIRITLKGEKKKRGSEELKPKF